MITIISSAAISSLYFPNFLSTDRTRNQSIIKMMITSTTQLVGIGNENKTTEDILSRTLSVLSPCLCLVFGFQFRSKGQSRTEHKPEKRQAKRVGNCIGRCKSSPSAAAVAPSLFGIGPRCYHYHFTITILPLLHPSSLASLLSVGLSPLPDVDVVVVGCCRCGCYCSPCCFFFFFFFFFLKAFHCEEPCRTDRYARTHPTQGLCCGSALQKKMGGGSSSPPAVPKALVKPGEGREGGWPMRTYTHA